MPTPAAHRFPRVPTPSTPPFRRAGAAAFGALLLVAGCGQEGTTAPDPTPTPTSLHVLTSAPVMYQGDTLTLAAAVRDREGNVMEGQAVEWAVDAEGLETVATARVVGKRTGPFTVRATSGALEGSASVTVVERPTPRVVSVAVLNFDPWVSHPTTGARVRLHEAYGWADPRQLAQRYADDLRAISRGRLDYRVTVWRDLDEFPVKVDGFRNTEGSFGACWRNRSTCHAPNGFNYPRAIEEHGLARLVDEGAAEEVWLFGDPYAGFWEGSMAGPGAFFINGGVYGEVPASRPFALMGFNYERGVAEMLHNFCHRTEGTMRRFYEGAPARHAWYAFTQYGGTGGPSGAGTCHYPPNGVTDYDYANIGAAVSIAPDFRQRPNAAGLREQVTGATWGSPSPHLGFMRWWLGALPHGPGRSADGRLNDWWVYLTDFHLYGPGRF